MQKPVLSLVLLFVFALVAACSGDESPSCAASATNVAVSAEGGSCSTNADCCGDFFCDVETHTCVP